MTKALIYINHKSPRPVSMNLRNHRSQIEEFRLQHQANLGICSKEQRQSCNTRRGRVVIKWKPSGDKAIPKLNANVGPRHNV